MKKIKTSKCLANKTKGITLIALVITIVVLLILASVSITAVFGDNGLLQMAKEAAEKTNEAVQKDKQDVQNMVTDIDDIINPPVDVSKLTEIVTENIKAIDKNGNKLIIPAGFKVLADTDDNNVEYEDQANPTVEDGIVIADSTGNEFVWVPVFDETPIYTTHNGRNIGLLYDFGEYESSQKKFVAKKPPTTIEWSTGYREPDTVSIDASNFNSVQENGYSDFKTQLQNEFNYLVKSVNKYKGFYIGRYETGALSSTDKTTTPKVQKDQIPGKVNWYYQYVESKNIASKNIDTRVQNSVTSSMIWGSQWDATLNWFLKGTEEEKSYVTNSTGWYKGETGNDEHATGKDVDGVKNKVKNIYDMAGNVADWTIEVDINSGRIDRGGHYGDSGSDNPASSRDNDSPNDSGTTNGSRSTLIVNL